MKTIAVLASTLAVAAGAAYLISSQAAAAQTADAVPIDADDIGGVVT